MTTTPRAIGLVVVLLGSLAGIAALDAQQPPRVALPPSRSGTAVITGTVVSDDDSARPVRGASVTLAGSRDVGRQVAVTNDEGHFILSDLPAGDWTLDAIKPGYVNAYFARPAVSPRGSSASVTIAEGERKVVTLQLARGAVLTGRIFDGSGRPQRDVRIAATRVTTVDGQRVADQLPYTAANWTATDDTGAYRLYGLPPGDYVINAIIDGQVEARPISPEEIGWAQSLAQRTAPPGAALPPAPSTSAPMGYAPMFFAGTPDPAAATIVTLAKGEERQGLDFSLQAVPLALIEGTLVDASGQPLPGVEVSLWNNQPNLWGPPGGSGVQASRTDGTGAFRFSRVVPGSYALHARVEVPSRGAAVPAPGSWARETLVISGSDLRGVTLRLQPGLTLSGRLVFEGSPPSDLRRVSLTLGPATMGRPYVISSPRIDADGTFAVPNLIPGRYRIYGSVRGIEAPASPAANTGPTPWMLKSVTIDGVETVDSPLEINSADVSNVVATFTDRPSEVFGVLVDADGHVARGFTVVIFATDRTLWTSARRVRWAGTDQRGTYSIVGLPAGEYYLAAFVTGDNQLVYYPSFLESLIPSAIKITLAEGEKKKQDLKLSGGSPD